MNTKHTYTRFSFILVLSVAILIFPSCRRSRTTQPHATVPAQPVYTDATQWYITDRSAPVDIFYIVSTETGDYSLVGQPCHFADTYNDSVRALLNGEMKGVEKILCGGFNFYSPYYRQCTLQTFTSDSLVAARMPVAMTDCRKAFAHYLALFNQGRPFILAGFSQGGAAVVDLLKQMDSATLSRMVAAYVIGWKVTDDDLAMTSNFRPAHDSADLGVTVCYNSVRDNDCALLLLSDGNRMAINPVNWHTDATPATLASPITQDTVIVTLDPTTLLLQVQGYSGSDYIIPLIGREGNYHSLEIALYQHCLRRNIALRSERFLALRGH